MPSNSRVCFLGFNKSAKLHLSPFSLDIDGSALDNSGNKKESVERTYQKFTLISGFLPSYFGSED